MDKNNVVIINLDRPREVRFGHSALKQMMASLNANLETFELNGADFEQVEKVMYFGLLSDARKHGEDLKPEDMEDLLDKAESFGDILEALNLAINKAFNQASQERKNLKKVATKTS